MISTLLFGLLLCILFFPVAIYYVVSLTLIVILFVYFMSSLGTLSSYVPFVLLLVYVGAMIIIFGYVCAVIPNVKSQSKVAPVFILLVLALLPFYPLLPSADTSSVKPSSFLAEFFYTNWGVYLLIIVAWLMIMTLLGCSHRVKIKATLRRF